jgi:cytochrome c oxidase subunit 2
MDKIILMCLISLVLLIAGCAQPNPAQQSSQSQVMKENVIPESQEGQTGAETEPASTDNKESSDVFKEFSIEAKQFEFNPNTVTVNKGDKVKLTLTSIDVTHGFAIDEYGISIRLMPQQPEVVEFTADKTGEFVFYCNVPCGPGHKDMRGKLIVE